MDPESIREDSLCLPNAIGTIFRYWKQTIDLTELAGISRKYCSLKGAPLIDGIELAESKGFSTVIYQGSIQELQKRIYQGIPPIVILPVTSVN
jgi:hypothetical protein